jgi:cytochrome b561
MKKMMKKMRTFIAGISIMMLNTAGAYASGSDSSPLTSAAKKASDGIQAEGKNMVPYILIIALVIGGFVLIVGGQRGRETVKMNGLQTIVGVALIVGAAGIGTWLFGLFG